MSPPSSRGTIDILLSCTITLSLCVYTAIHLNIPAPGEPKWYSTLRKAKWTIIGIFAPEIALFTAWDQFWEARKLSQDLTDEYERQCRPADTVGTVAPRWGLYR